VYLQYLVYLVFLGRIAATASCGLLLQMELCGLQSVCLSCLLVTFVSPAKRLNWLGLTRMGPRNHVLNGGQGSPWELTIFGVSGPLKALAFSAAMYVAKRDHSSVNNGMQWKGPFNSQ